MSAEPSLPSEFYTGVVADIYRHLRSSEFDPEPYARFVQRSGEPALELGCGDGDPMLALRARGLEVEGLDSSADMLARCRRAAARRGLDVTLHHATFETMDLARRYRSIYFAGPTFNLLIDDASAQAALGRIVAHLHPDGRVMIPLFVPARPIAEEIGRVREHVTEDGVVMRLTVVDVARDEDARTQVTELRYELIDGDGHRSVTRQWRLHWFDQRRFVAMAQHAGLAVRSVSAPNGSATGADSAYTIVLTPQPASS